MTGERVLSTFSMILMQVVGLGVLFFWVMGAIMLFTGNGGQINDINLTPFWRNIYFAFPFLLILLSPIAWLAYFRQADILANTILVAPVGILGIMYFFYVLSNKPF